jgi:DNA-directed RNA polymerase specialized sigma24 family protein
MLYRGLLEGKAMDKSELIKRILQEEDYIRCRKFSNSLNEFLSRNFDGVKNSTIARLLMMSEDEVEKIYEEAIAKLRKSMVKSKDEN